MVLLQTLTTLTFFATGTLSAPRLSLLPQSNSSTTRTPRSIDDFRPPLFSRYANAHNSNDTVRIQASGDYVTVATRFVSRKYPGLDFRRVEDAYQGINGVGHVNFRQTVQGRDLDNANINVNVARDGSILSYGTSAFEGEVPSAIDTTTLTRPESALHVLQQTFGLPTSLVTTVLNAVEGGLFQLLGARNFVRDPLVRLVYYRVDDETVVPAWRVETDTGDSWLTSYVNAADKASTILAVSDYGAHASYSVYKWPIPNPNNGSVTIVQDPGNTTFSPYGWQATSSQQFDTTQGNNCIAQPNHDGDDNDQNEARPQSSDFNFTFPLDLTTQDPLNYTDFSTTQLFYTANKYHDVLYSLGFNEVAGNFQDDNGNKGGLGGDAVILNTQDGSGLNNANFATPPDGSQPRMRMYIWDITSPRRDSSLDAGVVIHEFTHGLSNRLTGGPANGQCLTTTENGGMGEGWSDWYPTAIRISTRDNRTTDSPIGEYVSGNPRGIRSYPYSTSLDTNPLTFTSLNKLNEVHEIGTVWCTFLYEMLWNLIDEKGNSDEEFPTYDSNGVPTDGRWLALKLVTDGLALQPCNPTFLQARDAIIDADVALTGGNYSCPIWKAFAKRGMGVDAGGEYPNVTESDTLPQGCS